MLAVALSAICFNVVFLSDQHRLPFSFWHLILAVSGLKLLVILLASWHERYACQLAHRAPERAIEHLHWALRLTPGNPDLYLAWGHLLYLRGDLSGARTRYQQAQSLFPLEPEPAVCLARLELSVQHWDEAGRQFARAFRLVRGVAWNDLRELIPEAVQEPRAQRIRTSWSKLCFDEQQLQFLIEGHYLSGPFLSLRTRYQDLMRAVSAAPLKYPLRLSAAQHAQILPWWGRNTHLAPVPAFPSQVVTLNDPAALEAAFQTHGYVVIDQLLAPDAREALLHFCQKSTIWHDDHKVGGYLGSYPEMGFNCPLLLQVARELKEKLPAILGAWSLLQMWGYNHDSRAEGIGLHADAAAVNVNLWLTPDQANADPDSGGLILYPLEAPPDWDFLTLNTDTARMEALIAAAQTPPRRIGYACNRAVIFRSRFFHATDRVHFHAGYLNRRINVTFLYGRYQPDLRV